MFALFVISLVPGRLGLEKKKKEKKTVRFTFDVNVTEAEPERKRMEGIIMFGFVLFYAPLFSARTLD